MDYKKNTPGLDDKGVRGGYAGVTAEGHIENRRFQGFGFRDRNASLRPGKMFGRHFSFCLSSAEQNATVYGMSLQSVAARFDDPPSLSVGFIVKDGSLRELGKGDVSVLRNHTGKPSILRTAEFEFGLEPFLGEIQICSEWDPSDPDPMEVRERRTYYTTLFRTIVAQSDKLGRCAGYLEEGMLGTF